MVRVMSRNEGIDTKMILTRLVNMIINNEHKRYLRRAFSPLSSRKFCDQSEIDCYNRNHLPCAECYLQRTL